jgi:hypothetical protein
MKRSVFGALMTLIVAFSIVVPVVQAQQTILRANVPFAFNIGDKQLPAGTYVVREMDRGTLIQSKDGENSVLGIYSYAGPSKADETKLVFHHVGDHYFLAQIWTSARGEGLAVPESKREKELRASNSGPRGGGFETVIVALR